jgi:sporulation protein YlmC with PRC-barrel domain
VRGDDATSTDDALHLVRVDDLHGLPVFSPTGKKLGVLEGVIIQEHRGNAVYAILCCTTFMGLKRTRRVLRRNELIVDAESGGFVLVGGTTHEKESAPFAASTRAPCRLDPARSV